MLVVAAVVTIPVLFSPAAGSFANAQQSTWSVEEALSGFGRAHPQCLQWTNWKKVCSRLGRNSSEVHCNTSSTDVRPSAPFCLAAEGDAENGVFISQNANGNRSSSYNRYCTSYGTFSGKRMCIDRNSGRPFGGLRIAELRHPYCEIWGNKNGQYCTENPQNTQLPSCQSMTNVVPSSSPLSCFKEDWNAERRDGCRNLRSGTSNSDTFLRNDSEILPVRRRVIASPIATPYCQRDR